MKKLYVIRHGKSDWGNPEVNDFNRPLNHRGLKDAPKMGKHLLENQSPWSIEREGAITKLKRTCSFSVTKGN